LPPKKRSEYRPAPVTGHAQPSDRRRRLPAGAKQASLGFPGPTFGGCPGCGVSLRAQEPSLKGRSRHTGQMEVQAKRVDFPAQPRDDDQFDLVIAYDG